MANVANLVNLGGSGSGLRLLDRQIFTSSGTWTKPADNAGNVLAGVGKTVRLWLIGGGGAGGDTGGGGGGGLTEKFIDILRAPASVSVTVGAGGAVRYAGGGFTTFGTLGWAGGGGAGANVIFFVLTPGGGGTSPGGNTAFFDYEPSTPSNPYYPSVTLPAVGGGAGGSRSGLNGGVGGGDGSGGYGGALNNAGAAGVDYSPGGGGGASSSAGGGTSFGASGGLYGGGGGAGTTTQGIGAAGVAVIEVYG